MLIFWQIPLITKQCFQNIRRTCYEFLFQKYSKDIPLLKPLFTESKELKVMFSKGSYRCLAAGKKIKISTKLLSIHNSIIIINLFRQVFNVSVYSAKWKIFVIACFWHHTIWQHVKIFLIAVLLVACCNQQRELSNLPTIGHWPAQSQQ